MKNISSKLVLTGVAMLTSLSLVACGGSSETNSSVDSSESKTVNVSDKETIAPAKMGPDGKYDQHGLAKRVKKAVDDIPNISDSARVYVAQKGSTVYLKGNVSDRSTLERVVSVARGVEGVEAVNTDGITLK